MKTKILGVFLMFLILISPASFAGSSTNNTSSQSNDQDDYQPGKITVA